MIKVKKQTTVVDKGADFILEQLRLLQKTSSIEVGFIRPTASLESELGGKGVNLATYADWQEYGLTNLPARPFLGPTLDDKTDIFLRQTATGMRKIYGGNMTVDELLNQMGAKAVKWTKTTIRQKRTPPNTPATVRYKRRMKLGRTPLIATGLMLNSVEYRIKKRGLPNNSLRSEMKKIESEIRKMGSK